MDSKKMLNDAFEKRLRRIERWLKRCVEACRCGAWGSAMMEIECMEAETREFRQQLWNTVASEASGKRPRPLGKAVSAYARVIALSALFVLVTGLPLAIDQDMSFYGFQAESLELLTSTEGDILAALRENLSSRNTGTVVLSIELPDAAPDAETAGPGEAAAAVQTELPRKRTAVVKVVEAAPETIQEEEKAPPAETGSSVEEVLSLIQVGQRALRDSEPAV
jgi:hypothetical protein